MGFYREQVFPRVMELTLGSPAIKRLRQQVVGQAAGEVLEIGFGTGLNLPCYGGDVLRVVALDVCRLLPRKVDRRLKEQAIPVELVTASAEAMPLDAGRFDAVVSTFTLCSVPDAKAALNEIRRVLKADGTFLVLEHGRSERPAVAAWQDRLDPWQQWLAEGCHLNRPIGEWIERAGFSTGTLDRHWLAPAPRLFAELYVGAVQIASEQDSTEL